MQQKGSGVWPLGQGLGKCGYVLQAQESVETQAYVDVWSKCVLRGGPWTKLRGAGLLYLILLPSPSSSLTRVQASGGMACGASVGIVESSPGTSEGASFACAALATALPTQAVPALCCAP